LPEFCSSNQKTCIPRRSKELDGKLAKNLPVLSAEPTSGQLQVGKHK